jgi:hypothetical protein
MTKKSQGRIARDRAKAAAAAGIQQQPQVRVNQHRPANLGAFRPTENGGYKVTAADRILAECKQGLGLVPAKAKNTCWDDLMAVYREAAAMLFEHTNVSRLLADKELISFIDDKETFNLNVKQFAADLGQINKELHEILVQHQDKSGGSEDPDVVLSSFAIYEQYKLWMTRHDGVIKPTVLHILEQTNAAELKRAAAYQEAVARQQAEQAAQGQLTAEVPAENLDAGVLDVGTVSDVQFQEVNTQVAGGKPLRGENSVIYHVDEAAFQPAAESHAHHPQHHKHEHHAQA